MRATNQGNIKKIGSIMMITASLELVVLAYRRFAYIDGFVFLPYSLLALLQTKRRATQSYDASDNVGPTRKFVTYLLYTYYAKKVKMRIPETSLENVNTTCMNLVAVSRQILESLYLLRNPETSLEIVNT
jgi:hypothetical protein